MKLKIQVAAGFNQLRFGTGSSVCVEVYDFIRDSLSQHIHTKVGSTSVVQEATRHRPGIPGRLTVRTSPLGWWGKPYSLFGGKRLSVPAL